MDDLSDDNLFDDEGVDLLSLGSIGPEELLSSQTAVSQITGNKESL